VLADRRPEMRVRRNYPYLGKTDGLTTYLRRQFPAEQYLGIELEVNQRCLEPAVRCRRLQDDLIASLAASINRPRTRGG
jgi:hypothetical protein